MASIGRLLVLFVTSSFFPLSARSAPREKAVAVLTGISFAAPTLHATAQAAWRWERRGLIVEADWNPFFSVRESNDRVKAGALNVGAGIEWTAFDGRARTALLAGPSVLLFDTALDQRGATGFFIGVEPVTIRRRLGGRSRLLFDPLSFRLVAPSLSGIPLIVGEYRTSVGIEWTR